jgi:hypothetical protein
MNLTDLRHLPTILHQIPDPPGIPIPQNLAQNRKLLLTSKGTCLGITKAIKTTSNLRFL